jgi:WD40 repeat protein
MNKQEFICDLEQCKLYLENPIFLTCCGSTVCQKHENYFEKIEIDKFKCPICNQQETIPQNGFPINRKIMSLINNGDHLGEIHKKVLNSINELESKMKEKKSIKSEEIIFDFFSNLRNQIDLHRDQAIEQIHKKSEELLAFLKEEEDKCKENDVNIKNVMLEDPNPHELPSWKNLLRKIDFKKEEAAILLNQINDKINQIKYDISKYKNDCLMNKKIEFVPFKIDNYFGDIEMKTNLFKVSNDFGKLIKKFNHIKEIVRSFQVIEDANKLISIGNEIKIWDLQSGECFMILNEHSHSVTSVLIYQNNKFISGSVDKTIKIWDLESFECIQTLYNNSTVTSLLLLSDEILASGLKDGTINIWNLNEKKIVKSIKAHKDWIRCLTKSKDTSKLISGSDDSKIKIWDSNNFQLLKELAGHAFQIRCLKMLNDETILSGSDDKTIKIWKIDSGECLKTLKFNDCVNCVETFSDDKMLIIGISSGQTNASGVIIYDLNKYEEVKRINSAHSSWLSNSILLSNGNLLTSSGNGEIKLWKLLDSE